MKSGFSKFVWGTFLLLAAAFVIANQVNGFAVIGTWGIIVAILAVAFIVQCLVNASFAPLPLPIAMLYLIFCETLNLPQISTGALIFAAILAWIGLGILIPRKPWYHFVSIGDIGKRQRRTCGKPDNNINGVYTETVGGGNNPVITVNFGAVSRRIHADNLETVQLNCNFGAIEACLDDAQLCGRGATANISCSFGAVSLQIPKTWRVIDNLDCTLGGVDIGKHAAVPEENAPTLMLKGNVSLGGVEVKFV